MALLRYLDGKAYNSWYDNLTPDTVISILSIVARSSLLLPVAEALGQLKWYVLSSSAAECMGAASLGRGEQGLTRRAETGMDCGVSEGGWGESGSAGCGACRGG